MTYTRGEPRGFGRRSHDAITSHQPDDPLASIRRHAWTPHAIDERVVVNGRRRVPLSSPAPRQHRGDNGEDPDIEAIIIKLACCQQAERNYEVNYERRGELGRVDPTTWPAPAGPPAHRRVVYP